VEGKQQHRMNKPKNEPQNF